MINCPDYCQSNWQGREFCQLTNGCKVWRRESCSLDHTVKRGGCWQFAEHIELGGLVKCNGNLEFRVRCSGCGRESSGIGNDNFKTLLGRGHRYSWTRTDGKIETAHCCVTGCTTVGFEMHHFAPQNTFPDFDDWPLLPVCRDHHQYWHQMMNGYRWSKPSDLQLNTATNS